MKFLRFSFASFLISVAISVLCLNTQLAAQSNAYAVDGISGDFVSIDLSSGLVNILGSTTANGQGGDFGPIFQLGFYTIQNGMLVQVFPPTGITIPVGTITGINAGQTIIGLGYHHLSATMYLVTTNVSTGGSELYTLDFTTAVATFVAAITNAPFLVAIAIDCIGNIYGFDDAGDNLIRIDRMTGVGTVLGPLGVDVGANAQDADWDPSTNTLYWTHYNGTAGELRSVNVDTVYTELIAVWQPYYFISFGIYAGDCLTNGLEQGATGVPSGYRLSQNHPNPFNPATTISFTIPETEHASLKIYDVQGREVAVLVNRVIPAGSYRYEWKATAFPSGTYFYKITAGKFSAVKKMILLK